MSTVFKNREKALSAGLQREAGNLWGVGGFFKVAVVEVDDMSAVANNDVVFTFPTDAILIAVGVKNYGSTDFDIATSAAIDDGTTDQTGDIKDLAAGTTDYAYVQPAKKAAGSQLLWDLGGANSSEATAKARVIIVYATYDNIAV